MRVLYFIESLAAGGKERRLVELIFDLTRKNLVECEVVLTTNEIHYKKILDLGIKIHVLERTTKKDISVFGKFYKIAKQFKPDIIHVWGNLVATYAIPAKILLSTPLINNQITDVPLEQKWNLNFWINFLFSDKIVANTRIGLLMYKTDARKSSVIYNGFDSSRLYGLESENSVCAKLKIGTPFVVGMVATFSESKDYSTFLEAAIEVLKIRSDITFLCVGSGDSSAFEKMIPPVFKNAVLFLGPRTDVEAIMNICDVGVLTSYGEGISNALLEFMALGKPVVATNLGGTPELVEDTINGYLVGKSNSAMLFQKIQFLINNKPVRLEIGEQNKRTVKEKFGIDKMTASFMELYRASVKK